MKILVTQSQLSKPFQRKNAKVNKVTRYLTYGYANGSVINVVVKKYLLAFSIPETVECFGKMKQKVPETYWTENGGERFKIVSKFHALGQHLF